MMRRYGIEMGLTLLAYGLVLSLSLIVLNRLSGSLSPVAEHALTLAPMLPGLATVWVVLRGLRRADELQRQMQLEALGFAFASTAVLTFSYGFLENIGYPRLTMFVVWPVMATLWVLGGLLSRLRY